MPFLTVVKALLTGANEIQIHLSATDAGHRVMVTPTLASVEPETQDAELAHLQAVLAMPFIVNAPADADLDAVVVGAMQAYKSERAPKLSDLDAYRARVAAADEAEKARKAQAEADKKKGAKPTGKGAPAKATPAKAAPEVAKPAATPDLFAPAQVDADGKGPPVAAAAQSVEAPPTSVGVASPAESESPDTEDGATDMDDANGEDEA